MDKKAKEAKEATRFLHLGFSIQCAAFTTQTLNGHPALRIKGTGTGTPPRLHVETLLGSELGARGGRYS